MENREIGAGRKSPIMPAQLLGAFQATFLPIALFVTFLVRVPPGRIYACLETFSSAPHAIPLFIIVVLAGCVTSAIPGLLG